MDWRTDPNVRSVGDQFMFGPAILVNPVLRENATQSELYLPATPQWYDFWTGTSLKGGQYIRAEAPLDRIPLFIRAGAVIPLGLEIEYADEKPQGPIELRIYTGAEGNSTCTQTKETTTTTKRACMPLFQFVGMTAAKF